MIKKLIGILLSLFVCFGLNARTIVYTADNVSVFPNPERGFTDQINDKITDNNPSLLKNRQWYFSEKVERETQSLVVLIYYLQAYRTTALSENMLLGFDTDMQILRDNGFKCVLRFAYTEDNNNDATPEQVVAHLAQLKPYLTKNADVIYVLEAGFVGQWGEWYYSSHFGNETQQLNANRRKVVDALLDACPNDRCFLVRYPLIKTQYLGDEQALTAEHAYAGDARARIGHHNDAFLSDYGNHGTYGRDGNGASDDPILRAYIAQETLYVPNGGETNADDNWAKKVYSNAEKEMRDYHWSFCGAEYSRAVTDRWRNDGIFTTLDKCMGHRFQLIESIWPDNTTIDTELSVSISLKNTGFAPLYNKRTAYIVFRSDNNSYSLPLQSDPRTWTAEAGIITISESLPLPEYIQGGEYHLYLHLPDQYESLASDPRYAIRFANENTWDATTGMNDLNITLTITKPNPTQITHIHSTQQPTKIFKNNQVMIIRDDQVYTILGTHNK